jgi:Recombinase
MLLSEKLSSTGIARELNRKHVALSGATGASEWNIHRVSAALTIPKYAGCHVYGRTSAKLSTPRVRVPRSEWVLTPGAFESIIDYSVFSEAQRILREPSPGVDVGGELVTAGMPRWCGCFGGVSRLSRTSTGHPIPLFMAVRAISL